ncbi:MAG TPA: hypothetical protein VEO96_09295 [Thermoplasmata archaeon]|nr:hypothetical protein [Thermoplasmata archaeon]
MSSISLAPKKSVIRSFMRGLLAVIIPTLVFSIAQIPSAIAQTPVSTVAQWQQMMRITPTVGFGCFSASYPLPLWHAIPCSEAEAPREVVGNGLDWSAENQLASVGFVGYSGWFPSESGYSSESDSQAGNGDYSVQGNSNFYSIVYGGVTTLAWTQFVFVANYQQSWSILFIQWWLLGYGACPGGWTSSGQDCYMNSAVTPLQYFGPGSFASSSTNLDFAGGQSNNGIAVSLCAVPSPGQCWSASGPDTLSLLQNNNWQDIEWNVFGYCCGSQANFNAGFSLTLDLTPQDNTANDYATFACASHGFTGETNNLNLGTCRANPAPDMAFTESD